MKREFDIAGLPEEKQQAIRHARIFLDSLPEGSIPAILFAGNERVFAESVEQMRLLLSAGLTTDGARHKQWYLEQIAAALSIDLSTLDYERGIAP